MGGCGFRNERKGSRRVRDEGMKGNGWRVEGRN